MRAGPHGDQLQLPGTGFGHRASQRKSKVDFQHVAEIREIESRNDKSIKFSADTGSGSGLVNRRKTPRADMMDQAAILEEIAREDAAEVDDAEVQRAEEEWLKRTRENAASKQKVYTNKQNRAQQENPQFELSREMATFFLNAKIGRARRDA